MKQDGWRSAGVSTAAGINAGDNESAVFASRFPHAHAVAETLGMAALLRTAADDLDVMADNAGNYESGSLRRLAHGRLRRMMAEITGKVSL